MRDTSLAAWLAGTAMALAMPTTAHAEDASRENRDVHTELGADIVVTAAFARDRFAMPTAVGILEGADLIREMRPTIGETLARQPGVSASSFGPGSSRPVLRGLDADRVRVLTDGIGSFDVSNSSADHAVAINPLTADRIEVVRGPASLLFGSSAIGGVVNVTDNRIARAIPEEFAHIEGRLSLGSAADERSGGLSIDLPVTRTGLVLHADGSFSETGDYRTGGYIYGPDVRAHADHHGEEIAEKGALQGHVANSASKSWEVAGGLSWIGDGGNMGFSISRLENRYAVPNRWDMHADEHEHEHEDEEGEHAEEDGHENGHEGAHSHHDMRIHMRQTRVDARAELDLSGPFEKLAFRFGWADYRHDEVDGEGHVATRFFNEGLEARLQLVQADRHGWRGASGLQYMSRRFEAVGEEAAVPLNTSDQLGLFTVQSLELGDLTIEGGARYERTHLNSVPMRIERQFEAVSASAGASLALTQGLRLAANLAYSERAPSAEELLSDGAHAATHSYEMGNADLQKERSLGAEAVLRGRGEGWKFELSGFYNRFENFIYLNPTGDEAHGLPVYAYQQAGANHWGFEAEGEYRFLRTGGWDLSATALVDYARADLRDGGGVVPRMPALRAIAGLEAASKTWGGRVEVEHSARQSRVAASESETAPWTMVNASIHWRPFGEGNPTVLMASVNNLFDVEARRHTSFLKDYAPMMGRDFRLSARFSF